MTNWNCILTFSYFNFGFLELNPGELHQNLAKVLSQKNRDLQFQAESSQDTIFHPPHPPKEKLFCMTLCKKYYFYKASSNNWSALTCCQHSQRFKGMVTAQLQTIF